MTMSKTTEAPAKAKRADVSRRDLIKSASATAATAVLMSTVRAAFPSGVFAQGAGPEVKGTRLGYIALTDASPLVIAKEKGFFAKHPWHGLGEGTRRVDTGDGEPMLAIDDLAGLIGLVQSGVVEIHPWGSTVDHLDEPDRLIFDLDPGDDVPWSAVIDAAIEVRDRLRQLKLESFVKTSGGKGLHVVVPIAPKVGWDDAKAFTASIAQAMSKDDPKRYVATMSKRARQGRVFVDYFRNGRGATAVAAYSTRARPEASVSTPLAWEELSQNVRADHFTIGNLRQRLDFLPSDPWGDFFRLRQKLPS